MISVAVLACARASGPSPSSSQNHRPKTMMFVSQICVPWRNSIPAEFNSVTRLG